MSGNGELVHIDVKQITPIPDGGGWRIHGRGGELRKRGIGYGYAPSMVDDASRLAGAEIFPDETGETCAGFLARVAAHFAAHGVGSIERVMTGIASAYRHSHAFHAAVAV